MKIQLILIATFLPYLAAAQNRQGPPDIPPDATSSMYQQFLSGKPAVGLDGLQTVVSAGERNLDWLEHINSFRPADQKLSFTSKETQRGIPIDSPKIYNPSIIQDDFAKLSSEIPEEIRSVLLGGNDFTDQPPLETQLYLEWCRNLDRIYQTALRWRTMSGWLGQLEGRRKQDIRGYYHLSRWENRSETLRAFSKQPPKLQAQLREWLVGLCFNGDRARNIQTCEQQVDEAIRSGQDLEGFYQEKSVASAAIYNAFFTIPSYAKRSDFRWTSDGMSSTLTAPFRDPEKEDVRHFVQFNIEDAWRFGDWKLSLPLVNSIWNIPHIVFRPGATPNVNGLGGSRITMNSNQPLTEYDAQWTIRHEFGHVLGLPDCYVEFYVREISAIVNYQIDVDNIMCSRRGTVNEINVKELNRTYGVKQ